MSIEKFPELEFLLAFVVEVYGLDKLGYECEPLCLNFYGEDLGLMNSEGEPVSDARLRCYVEALVLQLKLFEL